MLRCSTDETGDPVATKVYLSTRGGVVDPADATVSAFDRGFLYGDSVYETLRTSGPRRVVALRRHLERLHRSAAGIGFSIPFSDEMLIAAIDDTLTAAENAASRIRVVITRGTGPIALDTRTSSQPMLVVYVEALQLPDEASYTRGLSAALVDPRTVANPGLKTGNYLPNILALRQAIERAGDDAIMCNRDGFVTEGATSNVFVVASGEICTPSLETGLLAGITRSIVFELCDRLGASMSERAISPHELAAADELFLTSSVRGIMPVTRLDGETVGAGCMGPLTRKLWEAYEDYVRAVGRGECE
ncbi:MAG: aminotransferase [Myxococcales bacterium FL481]|nr:MAG: aminotransferase [Myxococcales bacterium FL481]